MTADLLLDVGEYLVAHLGLTWPAPPSVAGDLFTGFNPPSPDAVTVLLESPGFDPVEVLGASNPPAQIRPRLQVLTRAGDYYAARDRMRPVWDLLRSVVAVTLNGRVYARIQAVGSGPAPLGEDEQGRFMFSANFDVWRDPE